jgi:BirA family biotin operon repressor/biotin-[acetyl-CoA-carboxylase] ligase
VTSPAARTPLDEALLRELAGEHWHRIDIVEQTGSTNADLVSRATTGKCVAGCALIAESQTAGRGRHGRSWSTPARSQIAMSVGVDATGTSPDTWGWLPLLTGVAVAEAVNETIGIPAGLKWPNDVLVHGHKLAGILAEVAGPGPTIIVGLGLNVSLTAAEAPVGTATSLAMLGKPDVDRNALAANILRRLADRLRLWRAAGADDTLAADYRRLSVTLGARVRATLPGERELTGIARDIDELGRLVIDGDDGRTSAVAAGDITQLRPAST